MALSIHFEALESAHRQFFNFKLSLQLYGMAAKVLEHGEKDEEDEKSPRIYDVAIMAILNNMSNIHAHLFDQEGVEACLMNLRQSLSRVKDAKLCIDKVKDAKLKSFFGMNATLLDYDWHLLAVAPAA